MPRHKQRVPPRNERPACPICEAVPKNLVGHLMTNHNISAKEIAQIVDSVQGVPEL